MENKYYILEFRFNYVGDSGEEVYNNYDIKSACQNCGTGAILTGKLYVKGISKTKKEIFYTLAGDTIITESLYHTLLLNNIKLGVLQKVIDKRGIILPFYHLYTKLSFPKSLPKSKGLIIEDQCTICKQNGYFNDAIIGDLEKNIPTYIVPLELYYDKIDEDFLSKSDFFNTWEHMGLSNIKAEGNKVVGYARPMLIISEKFKLVLEDLKIKGLEFSEIKIG